MDVSAVQPYQVTNLKISFSAVLVSILLLPLLRSLQAFLCFDYSLLYVANVVSSRGVFARLFGQIAVCGQFLMFAKVQVERCMTSAFLIGIVDGKLSHWQQFIPIVLLRTDVMAYHVF